MLSFNISHVFVSLVYIVCAAHCLHIHRPCRHAIDRRDATTTSLQSTPSSTPDTEAAELIETVISIQEGLSDLPQDFFVFLKAIDDRLHEQEALLASLLAVLTSASGAASSTVVAIDNATTSSVLASFSTTLEAPSTIVTEMSSPSAPTTACRRGGAGPLVPCSSSSELVSASTLVPSTSSPRSRVTRTLTRTTYLPLPVTTFTQPLPFSNTTAGLESPSSTPVLPIPAVYSSDIDSSNTNTTATSADSQALATLDSIPKPTSTSYTFKPTRKNNVAVYYGQTPTTQTGDLLALCQNPNVDIVVLAFVTSFFTNGGFPSASFGPSCKGSTRAQQLHAPGLQDCTDLAPEILACQELGKPVLVSLGGYYSNVTFTSDTEAIQLAQNLWDLFGAGNSLDPSLRPFGSIVIDGFDLDNESKDSTSYTTFAHALRALFASDGSKKYYLSAAPQCPRPDTSLPISTLALCDFVFVQFYNNPSCDLSSPGFAASFAAWSDDLTAANNETKLFIGAGAFPGAGSGYVEGAGLGHRISLARQLYVENLGGVMLWDGREAVENVDEYGNDYLVYTKGSLQ